MKHDNPCLWKMTMVIHEINKQVHLRNEFIIKRVKLTWPCLLYSEKLKTQKESDNNADDDDYDDEDDCDSDEDGGGEICNCIQACFYK